MKKSTAVAKPAKPAKHVVHHQKLTPAQHHKATVAAHKAALTRKHNAAAAKKHAGTHKHAHRGWTADGDVAMCSARAIAESLRLDGGAVSISDVLAIYRATAAHADAGASIVATLDAVSALGLGGRFPLGAEPVDLDDPAAVILGLALPQGLHTVLEHDGTWWSWGEPHDPADFPGAVIEEAWALSWR